MSQQLLLKTEVAVHGHLLIQPRLVATLLVLHEQLWRKRSVQWSMRRRIVYLLTHCWVKSVNYNSPPLLRLLKG